MKERGSGAFVRLHEPSGHVASVKLATRVYRGPPAKDAVRVMAQLLRKDDVWIFCFALFFRALHRQRPFLAFGIEKRQLDQFCLPNGTRHKTKRPEIQQKVTILSNEAVGRRAIERKEASVEVSKYWIDLAKPGL